MQLQAEDGEAGTELKSLLKHTAEVYRTLLGNAQQAGIAVPPEAQLQGPGAGKAGPRWDDFAALDAEDWEDFEDEGGGNLTRCLLDSANQDMSIIVRSGNLSVHEAVCWRKVCSSWQLSLLQYLL